MCPVRHAAVATVPIANQAGMTYYERACQFINKTDNITNLLAMGREVI